MLPTFPNLTEIPRPMVRSRKAPTPIPARTPKNKMGNREGFCPKFFQIYIPQTTPAKTLPTQTSRFLTNFFGKDSLSSDSSDLVSGNGHIGQIVSSIHFWQLIQKKWTSSLQSSLQNRLK